MTIHDTSIHFVATLVGKYAAFSRIEEGIVFEGPHRVLYSFECGTVFAEDAFG
jgi:hypothetical protein